MNEDGVLVKYNGSDTDVAIPEQINGITITKIGNNAFADNAYIESVTIPDNVKSIGNSAFANCELLKKIDTNKTEAIGDTAFYGCANLEELIFGENVSNLGMRLCAECKKLRKLTVLNKELSLNGTYMWPDGVIEEIHSYVGSKAERYAHVNKIPFYDIESGERIRVVDDDGALVAYNGGETEIIIPESVDGIEVNRVRGAFAGSNIVSVTIPDCVTVVAMDAFSNCAELKQATLSNGITKLNNGVFKNCISLEKVVIPPSITSISESAFDGCDKSKLTIYGASGSAAEEYAKEHDIKFIADKTIPTPPPVTPTPEPTPTAQPTAEPTQSPTAAPTTQPTTEPTQSPTPESTETPESYKYPYRITAHSTYILPGYVSITAECYEKKEDVVMIFALYNENGTLGRVNTKILSSNSGTAIMETFPYTDGDGQFKVFIWNKYTQEPYSTVFIGE